MVLTYHFKLPLNKIFRPFKSFVRSKLLFKLYTNLERQQEKSRSVNA